MKQKSLTLYYSQAYHDAWEDYKRALLREDFPVWDYVLITASNEKQASSYRMQLARRKEYLPKQTHYAVIPDEGNQRVGSGGATLSVMRYIIRREKSFNGLKILVIHSGGDSKRVPQYSALGKLFSPVPHELPDGRASTLFDEFMIGMSTVPSRIPSGMLLLSGDVLLLFNPLLIDYSGHGAAVLSFREDVETGKDHGVYLRSENGNVKRFLHKMSVKTLREQGAVNEYGDVNIDTGAVIFGTDMLESLYGLIDTDEKYFSLVNSRVRLSLYADFQYPLAEDSTLEQFYHEKPEGEFCEELEHAREKIWAALRPYRMKLMLLAPAKFIHFGTTAEILGLLNRGIGDYVELGWQRCVASSFKGRAAGYLSVLSEEAQIGENCYLEVSCVHSAAKVGRNSVLSYVEIRDGAIPPDVVLHGLKLADGRFVCRIYGVNDNPKEALLFGKSLSALPLKDLWDEDAKHDLWNARLYSVCDSIHEAVAAALNLYALAQSNGDVGLWQKTERKSLYASFEEADPHAIIEWETHMRELVQLGCIERMIAEKRSASQAAGLLNASLSPNQKGWLESRLSQIQLPQKLRLLCYIGAALGSSKGDKYMAEAFHLLRNSVLSTYCQDGISIPRIVTDSFEVKLPLRVNFGGGWSDTPPYCIENGGTVLNAAITLNGEFPVHAQLRRISEKKIVFVSRDMDIYGTFDTLEPLQQTGDPFDPFALQKAALLICGILPSKGDTLSAVLERLGGGFELGSEVTGVPKGSGLGTSSILAAACVKCISGFFGLRYTNKDMCEKVLAMEQLMSTGGGWQDQLGGLTPGVKYCTSIPGLKQEIRVETLELSSETKKELQERFAIIYTGQRRLARNLLRDVVGRYLGNEDSIVSALDEVQRVATLMRFELLRGHVDDFAELMNRHWELSLKIDADSTNTLIDQIFDSINDLIDAKMICGAGGGGFLQVIKKKGVTDDTLHERLKSVFADSTIDVWDKTMIFGE